MLYSHSEENEKVRQFAIFLTHAAKGDMNYAKFVNEILVETHQFAAGEKTLYDINRDSLHIILLLSDADNNFFLQLKNNPAQFNADTYSDVLKIIDRPKSQNYINQ